MRKFGKQLSQTNLSEVVSVKISERIIKINTN